MFFDPPLPAGNFGFQLTLDYEHEVEPVTPKPLENDKYAGVEEPHKARRHR